MTDSTQTPRVVAASSTPLLARKPMSLTELIEGTSLEDFWYWALAGNEDLDAEELFVEWMVGRMLGFPKHRTRRVPYGDEGLYLPRGVVVELRAAVDRDHRHFVFCVPPDDMAQVSTGWRPWRPEHWGFHLFGWHELIRAGVTKSTALSDFLMADTPMPPREFCFVARSLFGPGS
jgi:hypothetical protein